MFNNLLSFHSWRFWRFSEAGLYIQSVTVTWSPSLPPAALLFWVDTAINKSAKENYIHCDINVGAGWWLILSCTINLLWWLVTFVVLHEFTVGAERERERCRWTRRKMYVNRFIIYKCTGDDYCCPGTHWALAAASGAALWSTLSSF